MEELLLLGSEITESANVWPRLSLNPRVTMIFGPTMDDFFLFLASEIPLKRDKLSLEIFPK